VNGAAEATAAIPPVAWPQRFAKFRVIPRIDTYPWVVKFAQTFAGKLLSLRCSRSACALPRQTGWR
jgi:hypothetical protein